MPLIQTIDDAYQLEQAFRAFGRDYYTYAAYEALYEYYEQFDENIELDVIAICCEWAESNYKEIAEYYNIELSDVDEDEQFNFVLEYLNDNTTAFETENGNILYIQF